MKDGKTKTYSWKSKKPAQKNRLEHQSRPLLLPRFADTLVLVVGLKPGVLLDD